MSWSESPPFERGNSFVGGGVIDVVNDPFPGVNFEGKEYIFTDRVYGTGVPVKVRCVRNTTGGLILPSRAYQYDPAYLRQRVNATGTVGSQRVVVVDELLPAAGVQNNDLVYVVLSGPCLVYTPSSAGVAINQGDYLVATTAASTGAPDAGSVSVGATVGNTVPPENLVGQAMSATTTGNTNTGVLCMLESRW